MAQFPQDFSDRLLQCEIETPALREKYDKEMRTMFEQQLGFTKRAIHVFVAIVCLASVVLFAWLAIATYGDLPVLVTASFGIGIVFALAFAGLVAWIAFTGRLLLKIHPPAMAALVWVFTVFMVTVFMVAAPNSIVGLRMMVCGLVFLVGAAAFLLGSRTEQAELRTKEKLMEIEYRLADLAERIGQSQKD